MRLNPNSSLQIGRLRQSMAWSSKQLRPFREQYVEGLKLYAGHRYGQQDIDKTPINLMRVAVDVWTRQLVAKNPAAMVMPKSPALKADAYELKVATDRLLQEIKFGKTLASVVKSALFGMGVMKIGLSSRMMESANFLNDSGQPYADMVLFEDWLHDMTARSIEEASWMANRYRLPFDMVAGNPFYENTEGLTPTDLNDRGDMSEEGDSKSDVLSQGSMFREEYRDCIELWDVWLPYENLLITLPANGGDKPLRVVDWSGPETGPYHILNFSTIPGNVVPIPPALHLLDLQELLTRLFNKLGRQAERQKTVTIADDRAVHDGTAGRIRDADDGEIVRCNDVNSVREMSYGGVHQQNMAFTVWLRDTFSYLGGNIDAMAGLASGGKTLGQEQLLIQSSNEMMQDMQTKVVDFTKYAMTDLSWYLYSDPYIELPLVKRVEGYGDVSFTWGPKQREADFFQFNFEVLPHSLQYKGPSEKLNLVMRFVQQLLLPMAPMLQGQGISLNVKELLRLVAEYGDMQEVNDLIIMADQEKLLDNRPTSVEPKQSPVTSRNYTRQSIPSSGGGEGAELIKSLMGAPA